nr:demethylmenaquinone methyltransferase [Quercus suber]
MPDQALDAQNIYDERSSAYDDSWHPRFAQHIVHLAKIQPGHDVLDLACGTGLVTYLASTIVGPSGSVTGIDISGGMLKVAEAKRTNHHLSNIELSQHSITELDSMNSISGKKFDIIICASALVLLEDPGLALQSWASFLRPGGRLVTDVTHPASQLPLITLERVGQELGRPVPWHRVPFSQAEDLQRLMESAGLDAVETILLSQKTTATNSDMEGFNAYVCDPDKPVIDRVYNTADGAAIFDILLERDVTSAFRQDGIRMKAKIVFTDLWAGLARSDGKIYEVDGAFVGVGVNHIVRS